MVHFILLSLLAYAVVKGEDSSAAANKASPSLGRHHVVVLHNSDTITAEQVLGVFAQFGIKEAQAMQLVHKVNDEGSAVVVMGPLETCNAIGAMFEKIDMHVTVRELQPSDTASRSEFSGSEVETLDEATFQSKVMRAGQPTLVMFFAPWCGHCKQLVPEYKKVAIKLRNSGVHVAAVNCDQAPSVARQLGVQGYPTIKFMFDGRATDYSGPRSAIALASFAQGQARLQGAKATFVRAFGGVRTAMSRVLGGDRATQMHQT